MNPSRQCPVCQASLPVEAPEGFCPTCGFRAALDCGGLGDTEAARPSAPEPNDLRGSTLARIRFVGDYELLEEIGRGGMGVVFRARQITLNRIVAVKFILGGPMASRGFLERFKREAEAAARLDHPNIVPIYEVGEQVGQHYFSMRFIEGWSLEQEMAAGGRSIAQAAAAASAGPQFLHPGRSLQKEIVILVAKVARAVHYAHQRGVLHRDIKPGNILVTADREPYVTDFGLAKIDQNESSLTVSQATVGTIGYMAPEQAFGGAKRVTTAADVYSLGAVLYETLTGQPVFRAETPLDTMRQVLEVEPRRPSLLNLDLDPDLETVCLKCLEKDPTRRYRSADALADDLERWLRGEPLLARPASAFSRAIKWARRKPALATLTAGLIVAVAAGLTGIIWQSAGRQKALTDLRKLAYASDLKLAQQALQQDNLGRALERLNRHRPRAGLPDLTGWEWRYLWRQCQGDDKLFPLPEMKQEIEAVAFSPDGNYLAAGTGRNDLLLWDLHTTQKVAQVKLPYTPIRLTFSPDTNHLAVGFFQGGLELWDWQAPKLTHRKVPLLRMGTASAIYFDPDGKTMLAVDEEAQRLCRWDLATEQCQALFSLVYTQKIGFGPWSAFSRDGQLLATCSNGVAVIWDIQARAMLATASGNDDVAEPLAFSPDSQWLALGSANGVVTICQPRSGREVTHFDAHDSDLERGEFTPDGKLLVTAGYDHTLKLWRTSDWRLAGALRGHRGEVCDVAISPDGSMIASAGADGRVRFWSTQPPARPLISKKLPGNALSWSLSPAGQWLLLLFPNGFSCLWNLDNWQESPVRSLGASNITVAAVLNGGRAAAVGDSEGGVRLLDLATMKVLQSFTGFDHDAVTSINCSADGTTIVAQSAAHWIKAWNAKQPLELGSFRWTNNHMWGRLPISPNGRFLLTSTQMGETDVWSLPGLEQHRLPLNEKFFVTSVAFFHEGRRIVTASLDKSARIWDLSKQPAAPIQTMYSDLTGLRSVAISPDERRIAVGDDLGNPRKVKLFDTDSGQEVAVLEGPRRSIIDLAFCPDGNTLVAVSEDSVFVWRAPSWSEIAAKENGRAGPAKE